MKNLSRADQLWAEIDSTDFRREFRGVISHAGQNLNMNRHNVWRALFRTRSLRVGLVVIQLKREIERQRSLALKKLY